MIRVRSFGVVVCIVWVFVVSCGPAAPRFVTGEGSRREISSPSAHQLVGIASYYADEFHGRTTANGEIYDMHALTAAHRTLPFNTKIRVVNIENEKTVIVRINDRGPFKDNRVIDVSLEAAKQLGLTLHGTAQVKLEILESSKSQ